MSMNIQEFEDVIEAARVKHNVPGIQVALADGNLMVPVDGGAERRRRPQAGIGPPPSRTHYVPYVYEGAYGFAIREPGRHMSTNTTMEVLSVSKSVTTWGVLRMCEDAGISLDTPVNSLNQSWQLMESGSTENGIGDTVTIRHLLGHTGGISQKPDPLYLPGSPPGGSVPTINEWLSGRNSWQARISADWQPGLKFDYSNAGFAILESLVEDVVCRQKRIRGLSCSSFGDYMQQRVLSPMGMVGSYLDNHPVDAGIGYARYYGWEKNAGYWVTPEYGYIAHAPSSLRTTAGALARFGLFNMQELPQQVRLPQIVSRASIDEMHRAQTLSNGESTGWGLGINLQSVNNAPFLQHGGYYPGRVAHLGILPDQRRALAITTNCESGNDFIPEILNAWLNFVFQSVNRAPVAIDRIDADAVTNPA